MNSAMKPPFHACATNFKCFGLDWMRKWWHHSDAEGVFKVDIAPFHAFHFQSALFSHSFLLFFSISLFIFVVFVVVCCSTNTHIITRLPISPSCSPLRARARMCVRPIRVCSFYCFASHFSRFLVLNFELLFAWGENNWWSVTFIGHTQTHAHTYTCRNYCRLLVAGLKWKKKRNLSFVVLVVVVVVMSICIVQNTFNKIYSVFRNHNNIHIFL